MSLSYVHSISSPRDIIIVIHFFYHFNDMATVSKKYRFDDGQRTKYRLFRVRFDLRPRSRSWPPRFSPFFGKKDFL